MWATYVYVSLCFIPPETNPVGTAGSEISEGLIFFETFWTKRGSTQQDWYPLVNIQKTIENGDL